MKKKEFKANIAYLNNNDVYVTDEPLWDNIPQSRELYYRTPSGGDFSICVDELSQECVLSALHDVDVNETTLLWWNGGITPFANIKDLYDDIEQWKEGFIEIANSMPY